MGKLLLSNCRLKNTAQCRGSKVLTLKAIAILVKQKKSWEEDATFCLVKSGTLFPTF
jgi:hypothetical protein